jgi:O-antigen ligase
VLSHFKTQPSLMESLLRLSGTFAYANIAAMYFEALLPVALLLAIGAYTRRNMLRPYGFSARPDVRAAHLRRVFLHAVARSLALLLLVTALLFTYSRAALGVLLVLMLALLTLVFVRWGKGRLFWRALVVGGIVLVLIIVLSAMSPVLRLRFGAQDTAAWYDARYAASEIGTLRAGELRTVAVTLTNSGQANWRHDGLRPVMLAYHWYDPQRRLVDFEGLRTPLPRSIAPQESITLNAQVRAPSRPGSYWLGWDLVRENGGGWFSQGRTKIAFSPVTVIAGTPGASAGLAPMPRPLILEPEAPAPPRRTLWAVAADLWQERPIFGIGPDVYRHVYGARLGLQTWDERIHTNNLYLEILTGAGLLGLATFILLLTSTILPALRLLLDRCALSSEHWALLAACTLGLLAFLIHGLFDVFLAFTATYALFWALLGLTIGLSDSVKRET